MTSISEDPLFSNVSKELKLFRQRYLERIAKVQQIQKACKINTVLQSKRAQELKLNTELQERLSELSKKGDNLDRICSNFASGLTISDRDQQRLDIAKEMYEIGKNLTGIRFDYSAPANEVKGYIKLEARRILTPFSLQPEEAKEASEKLWALIHDTADEENTPHN